MTTAASKALLLELAERVLRLPFDDEAERKAIVYRAEMLIRQIVPNDTHYLKQLSQVSFLPGIYPTDPITQQKCWKSGCESLSALLRTVADQIWTFSGEPAERPGTPIVERICERFHLVARQLRSRHDSRTTLNVADEYDVQDLIHALLKVEFEDVRAEEHVPSYAGKASRMDFLLKKEKLVLEVKKARPGLGAAEVGSQLIEDIARYRAHPDCRTLLCFVYDPEGLIGNPRGLEQDLSRPGEALDVRVFIRP
jgi:hypothetical protein